MAENIRVVLVDDHLLMREGLHALMDGEKDILIVGEAEDGEQALQVVRDTHPNVVVMDLGMPGMSGIEAIKELRSRFPLTNIVVLSMHCDREVVLHAVRAGCNGYVPKSTAHTSLLRAIRLVHSGERYLHPTAAAAVMDELNKTEQRVLLLSELSDREQEVLRLTALGYTNREIAEKLSISHKTVDTYRQRGMTKLNLTHRADLVRLALKLGLLDDGSD